MLQEPLVKQEQLGLAVHREILEPLDKLELRVRQELPALRELWGPRELQVKLALLVRQERPA